jgi:protein-L-isoaspartate(D-aspartate) O-methyltransferase
MDAWSTVRGKGVRMEFAAARRNMVESQLRPNKVTNPAVLEAFAVVPREIYVPAALRGVAYVDEDIPVGGGRFLMEPMILARLVQTASPRATDAALVVGAGVGYSAAILSRLVSRVVALESDHDLAQRAAHVLNGQGVANAAIVEGPLAGGTPQLAPFDVILFDGSVDLVPPAIVEQLAENSRLVAVVNAAGVGRARLMTRSGGAVASRIEFDAAVPRLPGLEAAPAFVF